MARIPVGIQLYTVRNSVENDFEGTLRQLAEMGYKGVEFAGNYGGKDPSAMAAFLKEIGLKCCGQHTGPELICDPQSAVYSYARELGCPYLTTSGSPLVKNDWPGAIETYRRCGSTAKANGCQFTYHNHDAEFSKFDGIYAEDILIQKTDPSEVQLELDTYWIRKGGPDPIAYIAQYPGRVPQIHLKDMNPITCDFAEVGTGIMNLKGIFKVVREVGAKWIIIEQDSSRCSEMEVAQIAMDNIKAARLV